MGLAGLLIMQVCMSTQFGHPGDGHGGRSPTIYHKRPVNPTDMGIAHRTWPMGRRVLVKNLRTGKQAYARVIDRGPWGMVDDKGWFNPRDKRKPGNRARGKALIKKVGEVKAYRGCADLTPALVRALHHNRKERVQITLLRKESTR